MQKNSSSLSSRQKVLFMKDSDSGGKRLLQTGALSLLLHAILVFGLLGFSLRPSLKDAPAVYRVTILRAGDGMPPGGPSPNVSTSPEQTTPPPTPETKDDTPKVKPPKKDKKAEELSKSAKKEKTPAKEEISLVPSKREKEKREKELRTLREAIEDLHKTVALDQLRRKMATESTQAEDASKKPAAASSRAGGSGEGTGKGTGTGGVPGGPAIGSAELASMQDQYYSLVWAKIKKEWTIPEDFSKGKTNIETVIVVVIGKDGKILNQFIEKKSGNALYDQMAMRAIKKAEPLPPIPKAFSDETVELGFRFIQD